ncbi:hypothetical protein [Marilutibacter maris]|uniref:hypothetical protein n=1 Tax=Marilutibacter maris TaxID=1605891 RepID=UPI000DA7400D|nr:hypothetical protein [Lysobacter maris]
METKMVMAIGDSGAELTPANEAVEIPVLPMGPGNIVIPASIRFMASRGGYVPTKLRRVLRPNTRLNKSEFARIEFDCTPFVRYETDAGPVMGDWTSCFIRDRVDAEDRLFAGLSGEERDRIFEAAAEQ